MALHIVGFYPTAPGFNRRSKESDPFAGEIEFNSAVRLWEMLLFEAPQRQLWFDESVIFWNYLQRIAANYQDRQRQSQPPHFDISTDTRNKFDISEMIDPNERIGQNLQVINVFAPVMGAEVHIGSLALALDPEEVSAFHQVR